MSDAPRHLVVVPHTHWDREWHHTHEQFRHRLVRLVDRVLALLEGDPAFRHFMLDGQTIVVDDYLEVRPEARERLEKLVRDGRLLVGPWHVLPDEWLVSGEALIRNLRLGLAKAGALGGAMRVGYVPDQFGHVGQLPQLLAGFGFDAAVLWRGVGADVDATPFVWEGADGTRLLTVYLPQGYGNGAQLPTDPEALAERLDLTLRGLDPFSRGPGRLVMNGSDHQEPEPGLPRALEAACERLPGVTFEIGTLPGFVERVRGEVAPDALPMHKGELRSGLRAPLLPGCASARAPQKRAEWSNDRLLVRVLEPLAVWASRFGEDPDTGILDLAWRVALENHPHDSVCGCSVDRVHQQMDTRFQRVEEIASAHLDRIAGALCTQVRPVAGKGDPLVVWNGNGGGIGVVDAEVALDVPVGAAGRTGMFHLRGADGRRVPVHAELLEASRSFFETRLPVRLAPLILNAFGEEFAGHAVRGARWQVRDGCVHLHVALAEAPSGFDVRRFRRALEAVLARDDVETLAVEARTVPRLRLRFVDRLPGYGLRTYRVVRGRARPDDGGALASGTLALGGAFAENAVWRLEVAADGQVRLLHRPSGTTLEDAVRIVSESDRGDEYNFDPVPEARPVDRPERVRVAVERASEASVAVALDLQYRLPRQLDPARRPGERAVTLPVRLVLRLFEGSDRLDLEIELTNTAEDHRLRLLARAPFRARRFQVESAFEVVERPIAPAPDAFGEHPAERPIGAVPQRAFARIDDGALALTLANRGSAEVEAVPEGAGTSLAVTLLRAVGWLSRADLGLRPGHAGPPLPTPGAQVPGRHRVALSLRLHAADEREVIRAAHDFAWPAWAFVGAGHARAPLADGAQLVELDEPEVVVSAIEPRPAGAAELRLFNAAPDERSVVLAWGGPGTGLTPVDLAGRPAALPGLARDGGRVRFPLGGRRMASLRIR